MAPRASRAQNRVLFLAVLAVSSSTGCFPTNDGRSPPLDQIYFPVGLVVRQDPARKNSRLYVVNSDFDLQFNAGTVQAYDLDRIEALVPKYCDQDSDCAGSGGHCDSFSADPSGENTHFCMAPDGKKAGGAPELSPCGMLREMDNGQRLLTPGVCNYVDPAAPIAPKVLDGGATTEPSLLADYVQISAFATDMIFEQPPLAAVPGSGADGGATDAGAAIAAANGHGRLFIPVRGDATLHWIDVDGLDSGGKMHCGQGADHACDDNHRRGETPAQSAPHGVELTAPPEPYGVAASDSTRDPGVAGGGEDAIVTTHQSSGQLALFLNKWPATEDDWTNDASGGPTLEYIQSNLASGALAIANIPAPELYVEYPASVTYRPGFFLTYSNSASVTLVHYFADPERPDGGFRDPLGPFLETDDSVAIKTNSQGFTSRGIAVDPAKRRACEGACARTATACDENCDLASTDPATQAACEATCDASRRACLLKCAATPLDVYVSNRTPATLILGQTDPDTSTTLDSDIPSFYQTVFVSVGASRVIVGKVLDENGNEATRVFLVCFDQRQIFVYDPAAQRIETVISTGRGPHAFALDVDKTSGVAYGFIGHFTDSYIGIVDLNQAHTQNYGQIVLNIGVPVAPRAAK